MVLCEVLIVVEMEATLEEQEVTPTTKTQEECNQICQEGMEVEVECIRVMVEDLTKVDSSKAATKTRTITTRLSNASSTREEETVLMGINAHSPMDLKSCK